MRLDYQLLLKLRP